MDRSEHRERLGLVLAGGGSKARRVIARARREGSFRWGTPGVLPKALVEAGRRAERDAVPHLLDRLEREGWRWLTPECPDYPQSLEETADPPLGLFVRGATRKGPSVAIVGARKASAYGLQVARVLGRVVAQAGGTVISGMARGIDGAAHEGALEGGGPTWAVWGCGPDTIYPREHEDLARRIAENGLLITEYPPGVGPRRHHFPERNRIIAGLAEVVVVVEAAARSGAIVTARQALEEGREVMAVPGSIFSEVSVGPNGLLRAGATPLTGPGDLLETLGLGRDIPGASDAGDIDLPINLGEAVTLDELTDRMGRPAEEVQARVVELEILGRLERRPDGRIRRRG